jgi:hypothetical protein
MQYDPSEKDPIDVPNESEAKTARFLLEYFDETKKMPKSDTRSLLLATIWFNYQKLDAGVRARAQAEFAGTATKTPQTVSNTPRADTTTTTTTTTKLPTPKTDPHTPLKVGRRTQLLADELAKSEREPDPNRRQVGANELVIKVTIAGSGYWAWQIDEEKKKEIIAELNRRNVLSPEDDWLEAELKAGWTRLPCDTVGWKRDDPGGKGPELMFGGPMGKIGGILPEGSADYQISNSIANLRRVALQEIVAITGDLNLRRQDDIRVLLRAHSRGAVAATNLAKDLKDQFPWVKVELAAFDPVPGPYKKGRIPVSSAENRATYKEKYQKGDVSLVDESTIVYCVASGYADFWMGDAFTPQQVVGAKRLIISKQNHSAGLNVGFRFQDRIYSGSGLNNLAPGVYLDTNDLDENTKNLQHVTSMEDFSSQVRALIKERQKVKAGWSGNPDPDPDRKEIITQLVKQLYENKSLTMASPTNTNTPPDTTATTTTAKTQKGKK